MSQPPLIFCSLEFQHEVQRAFPRTQTIAFAKTVEACREKIATLDTRENRLAWILFKGDLSFQDNLPVKDHLNLSKQNPLIGPADLSKGPRFPDMSSVYESTEGIIVVLGEDEELKKFKGPWANVQGGVWEAIALKHRGYHIQAWLISDLEKWISEQP